MPTIISRRALTAGMAASLVTTAARAEISTVRVGYQKYGNLLILKSSGLLETKLKPLGVSVDWKQFVSGPPLMEALGAGAIDYGVAGETPPVFAQAAGAPIVYHAAEPPAPRGEAILVREDSPIKSVADLKGRKVAFNKGSNVHYLFVEALAKAGLSPRDVQPIYLNPADGRAAFERGSVDAWVIWDPYLAAAQGAGHTRILADGTGLVANHQFYLRRRGFTDKAVLDAIFEAIAETDVRVERDPAAAAKELAPEVGLPVPILELATRRQAWGVQKMDASLAKDQQAIADTFFKLGLIPKQIRIENALAPS